jgi:hypothetical protein
MMDICAEYGIDYDIMYNEKKSVCIVFSRKKSPQNKISVYLNGAKLECVEKVKHLGMWITTDMDNSVEINNKRGHFIGQANHVLSKYSKMYSAVKCRMIEAYCCHFYGSETWDFSHCNFNRILTSWNIAIRKAWNLPYMAHRYLLPVLAGHSPQGIIFSQFLSMYHTMCQSKNEHVQFIANIAKTDARSIINQNLQTIANEWRVDIEHLIQGVPVVKPNIANSLDDTQKHSILCVLEVDSVRNGLVDIPGFNNTELQDIMEYVSMN